MANTRPNGHIPIDIGSRMELMVDDYLIARMSGGAELRLHRPIPREVVLVTDEAWEGCACQKMSSVWGSLRRKLMAACFREESVRVPREGCHDRVPEGARHCPSRFWTSYLTRFPMMLPRFCSAHILL